MITDPVLGWRVWGWRDGRLWSPIFYEAWPRGERHTARCWRGTCPGSPGEGCMCGVNLATSEGVVLETMMILAIYITRFPLVWGSCSGWGRVAEHERGWRVQHAYPYELAAIDPGVARDIRDAYAVDCVAA